MRFITLFRDELRYIFTSPKTALILFGLPLCYSLLFGAVYGADVIKNIPTVILDQDQTTASRTLVQAFADSERYNIVTQASSQEVMEEALHDNRALAAIVIPPDFSRDIKLGKGTEVIVVASATNVMFANSVLGTCQEIVQSFSAGSGQKLIESLNQMPSEALKTAVPVRLSLRITNNPTLSYSNFIMAGISANGLQLAIIMAVCTVLSAEKLSQSQLSTSPAVLLAGKLLPYWLCSILSFLLYTSITVPLFSLAFKGSMLELLLMISAFTFVVVSIGGLFSAVTKNSIDAIQTPMLYIMPAFLFSGYSWPHLAMDGFSRAFSAILPITYAADTMRDIMLAGSSPVLARNVLILFTAGLAVNLVSALALVRRNQRSHRSDKGVCA
ncbi:ABC transporter permease [Sporomusa sp.]|uniref:ABC transporter permease n=1 Tax=Sporomusa sp. TaxID=2078658 RepID=UPI002CC7CF65|nr:ABC transporter permease [Sporomusa sp.]HWR44017.1 ABC transporter permease [Sporomusa sp.]